MSSLEKALFGLLSSEKEIGPTAYESVPTNEGRDDNKFLLMAAKGHSDINIGGLSLIVLLQKSISTAIVIICVRYNYFANPVTGDTDRDDLRRRSPIMLNHYLRPMSQAHQTPRILMQVCNFDWRTRPCSEFWAIAGIASGSGSGVKMSQLPPALGLAVLKMFGQMRAFRKIPQKSKHDPAFSEKIPLHGDWLFVEKEETIVVGSVKKVETGHNN
ncbi:hypothetical protein RhiJN_25770 [Ceratobasidium sp. AG-Ba]|nr:hypothetical protein RhiJN_25770 [Ceratobasidium sp. AG-Ba]